MFTGIIAAIGTVTHIDRQGDWVLTIRAPGFAADAALGASIACSGACLTVIARDADGFTVQASRETLDKTTLGAWVEGTRINLERALKLGDELGGHIVSGHVDTVTRLATRTPDGQSVRLTFDAPDGFSRFLAPKGSVVLDGISLTVNEADNDRFTVAVIPHTLDHTTLGDRQPGDLVNFEIDVVARYLDRLRTG